ncbi:MAG: PorP/SprF family type IX secretion system membrane protein [Breznakibacter sp.]
MKSKTPTLIACLFLCINALSQNIHFSQAYSAHLTLNPANTGRFNGDWRVTGMFRDQGLQFTSQYKTSYVSFEMPVYIRNERIATGIFYSHDNSAGSNLPVERIFGNLATSVPLSVNGSLTTGIQLGYVHKQISWNNISFPDQYNRAIGGFDPNLPTSERFETDQTGWLDLGVGLAYTHKFKKMILVGGYAMQQINTPQETFLGVGYDLPVRHVAHVKADWNLSDQLFVIPSVVATWQRNARQQLFGANLGVNLNEWMGQRNNFIAGVHYRNGLFDVSDALIFSTGFTYQYWSLLASFDSDVFGSKTGHASASAFELGLVFKLPSTELTYKTVPCERY